jgi:hypothetical protein
VFLTPCFLHFLYESGPRRALCDARPYVAALVAALIGLAWYGEIFTSLPGSPAYVLDNQILGRLFTARYRRNAGLWRGFQVYLPVLVIGSLPWTVLWPVFLKRIHSKIGFRRAWSVLPLYILPLSIPLSLAAARALAWVRENGTALRFATHPFWILPWCLFLLAAKGVAAEFPFEGDTRAYAEGIRRLIGVGSAEVVSVDVKLNGLPFYGYTGYEFVTTDREDYPFFVTSERLAEEVREIRQEKATQVVILLPPKRLGLLDKLMDKEGGMGCQVKGQVRDLVVVSCAASPP